MVSEATTVPDDLLTRVIIALQSQCQLPRLSIQGLERILLNHVAGAAPGYLPPPSDLRGSLKRLEALGYLELDESNPHVNVTLQGFITCAPLPIPEPLVAPLEQGIARIRLS